MIRQKKTLYGTRYIRTETDSNNKEYVVSEANAVVRKVTISSGDAAILPEYLKKAKIPAGSYYVLYDSNMNPVIDAFRFLNSDNSLRKGGTVPRSAYSLSLLFSFCGLYFLDYLAFPEDMMDDFLSFLKRSGEGYLKGSVRNISAEQYLADIRAFYKSIQYKLKNNSCPFLMSEWGSMMVDVANDSVSSVRKRARCYKYRYDTYRHEAYAPEGFSLSTVRRLLQYVRERGDDTGELLILMMAILGLRIGECLGCTVEDVTWEVNSHTGEIQYFLIIRNRPSDDRSQSAKRRMHLATGENFADNRDYEKESRLAKNRIMLTPFLSKKLLAYIKKHDVTGQADVVDPEDLKKRWHRKDNRYIFVNTQGRPLLGNAWSKRLRKYLLAIGETPDIGGKEKGLNHRFRHFAAAAALDKTGKLTAVRDYLGHKNVKTSEVYTLPTREELARDRYNVQKMLFDELFDTSNTE